MKRSNGLRDVMIAAVMVAAGAGILMATEMSSGGTTRITRTSQNSGGSGAAPMSSTNYRVRGAVAEPGGNAKASANYRASDGIMKIFFYPASIQNVTPLQGPGAGEMVLQWTAPGADGNDKRASRYVVKFSTWPDAITSQQYFTNTAILFTTATVSLDPGQADTITLTGLEPGTSYYVAIEAQDADRNQAYLLNSTYTWAQIALLAVEVENVDTGLDAYGFGTVAMSSAVVSTATIRVTNTGTTSATWSIRAATVTIGSPWQPSRAGVGFDTFRMSAAFHDVKPSSTAFNASRPVLYEDAMVNQDALSTGTTFTINNTASGVDVPRTGQRYIWVLLETPTASSTVQTQEIQMTVTANAP